MKRLILLGCLICTCSFFVYADEDCTGALQEAKSAYNAGEYQKAKRLYDYVVSECGNNYGNAVAMSRQCEEMLTPKLSVSRSNISVGASSGSTTLSVTSNRNWELRNTNSNMFSVYKNGNEITINYYANSSSLSRSDYFDVVTADGSKSVRITISQSAASIASALSVSKTSISCSASATTEYITVNCNTNWEIQYPTGNMYSVTRNGNTLKVTIYANTGTGTRGDFFNVRLVDGSKVIKVHLQQSGRATTSQSSSSFYSSSSSRSNYSNNSSTYYTRTSAYQRYIHYSGSINVTWIGISAGIGSGMSILGSTLRCRFGPVEIRPIDIAAIDYNFINGDYNFSYQPIIDFYVPVSADKAIYFGAGPSVGLIETNLWFRAEGGLHWNWGGDHASSDFFFRYDGAYMVGLSIQCSSHW